MLAPKLLATTIAVVFIGSVPPASADDAASINAALASHSAPAIEAMLADSVRVGPVLFHDRSCATRFGATVTVTGPDRAAVARCFAMLNVEPTFGEPLTWSDINYGALFTATVRAHQIVALGPLDPSDRDAALPTLESVGPPRRFEPSSSLRAALEHVPGKAAHVTVKSCSDGTPITSRIARTSGVPAFDREVAAYLAHLDISPDWINFEQRTITHACIVWPLGASSHPHPREVVQPVDAEENGVEGGDVESGDAGAPPAAPRIVSPTALETLRLSGAPNIEPDAATRAQIVHDGRGTVVGTWKLCVGTDGTVTLVALLKSTRYPAYDARLAREMHAWTYKPYLDGGHAVPVCTAETFIYAAR